MRLHKWPKSIVTWHDSTGVNISVVFTWHIKTARALCDWNRQSGQHVSVGGPAVSLMPDQFHDVADSVGGDKLPLPLTRHNPDATFTTRGCIRKCSFCAVPKIEGDFRELVDWTPAPIVCDNNLLASSQKHFDSVIDKLKHLKGVDFNQGLDARLFNDHHLERLKELRTPTIRFSWDHIKDEAVILGALHKLISQGFPPSRLQVYVLIGWHDTPEDALYRFETLKKLHVQTNPMRYQPLDAMIKNSYIAPGWTNAILERMMRYWSLGFLSAIPYKEFVYGKD